jgi:hypothetical protein
METKEIKGRKGRKIVVPQNLPTSEDKEFWGDSDVNIIKLQKEKGFMKNHYPVYIKGGVFVCQGCPYEHTINLDSNKFTIKDGYIVKRT